MSTSLISTELKMTGDPINYPVQFTNTLQGSAATYVRYGRLFDDNYYKLTTESTGERILKIRQYSVKLQLHVKIIFLFMGQYFDAVG